MKVNYAGNQVSSRQSDILSCNKKKKKNVLGSLQKYFQSIIDSAGDTQTEIDSIHNPASSAVSNSSKPVVSSLLRQRIKSEV